MSLDGVEPAGIGRRGDQGHVVFAGEPFEILVPMGREVVLDQIEPNGFGVAGPQPPPGHQDIPVGLAFVDGPTQAIAMHIVEGQQLLGSLGAAISSPQPLGMFLCGPALSGHGFEFHRTEFVETDHRSVARGPLVELQDTVFFDSN